jgi:hypothetical protein
MTKAESQQALNAKSTTALKMNIGSFHAKLIRHDNTALNGWAVERKLRRTLRELLAELVRRNHTSTEWTRWMIHQYRF